MISYLQIYFLLTGYRGGHDWGSGHRLGGDQHNFDYGFGVAGEGGGGGGGGGNEGDGEDAVPDPQRAGKVIQSCWHSIQFFLKL